MTQQLATPPAVRLNTTHDGWVIRPGLRFYNAEHATWGTVISPAWRDEPSLAAALYWLVELDERNGRAHFRYCLTGAHMLCHVPDAAYWDRAVAPDAENIARYRASGITTEDQMRKQYPQLKAARARYRREAKEARTDRATWLKFADDITPELAWIELVYRVRGLPVPR